MPVPNLRLQLMSGKARIDVPDITTALVILCLSLAWSDQFNK
jgi:hypothetical protein